MQLDGRRQSSNEEDRRGGSRMMYGGLGIGGATAQSGPFYCSGDQCVYIDLSFFSNMKREIGADAGSARAFPRVTSLREIPSPPAYHRL